jgi:hypothetical protein
MKKNDENEQLDLELEQLLSPIRNFRAEQTRIEKWQQVVDLELSKTRFAKPNVDTFSLRRRAIEWAVAASFGFVLATAWLNLAKIESEESALSGFDATELHLVAKSD